ncbi:MAG: macrolide ABC transporter ATP-binding protein [Gammaproteobacteria bacterium RIFCSPLOWO2_02_FULL_38_11]|nr:MAG: macrolide ABC transporter ATP-binding protein [Gammaproteobacteria bacterium RIFCSPLOWO2_02_FULL_38_11]
MTFLSVVKLETVFKSYFIDNVEYPILKGIDLVVHPGEMLAIVGESGSGKSTLMNIIGLLDHASSGKYYLNDHDVFSFSERELAKLRNEMIGFVFQSFYLLPRMTEEQNVSLPLLYRNAHPDEIKERARKVLEKVGLKNFLNRKPNQLSGGQQQRVAIARALVGDPHLLLADEPTGALDAKTSEDIMNLFLELNQRDKTTVILITHEEKVARKCSRVLYLEEGFLK